jgi:hypothetical protein
MNLIVEMNYPDVWTSIVRSSIIYFCEKNNIKCKWKINTQVPEACLLIYYNEKSIFIDCLDSPEYSYKNKVDYIFKRSFSLERNYEKKVYPLGFTFACYYKPFEIYKDLLFQNHFFQQVKSKKVAKIQLIRDLDFMGLLTTQNSKAKNPEGALKSNAILQKYKGNEFILYKTRLWNPDSARTDLKKNQRQIQNELRINWVKWLHKNFQNVNAGIQIDTFSKKMVESKYLLDSNKTNPETHFIDVKNAGICIADDGLEDTLGWRIGEYVWFNKPILTTPINIMLPGVFEESKNYIACDKFASEKEFVSKVSDLLNVNKMNKMAEENFNYYNQYMKEDTIVKYIFSVCQIYI